jgi:regulator of replication initiation timing
MSDNTQGKTKEKGKLLGRFRRDPEKSAQKQAGKRSSKRAQPTGGNAPQQAAPQQAPRQRRGKKGRGRNEAGPSVRPYESARPKRQTPKLVTGSYSLVGSMLNAVQPVNSLVTFAGMLAIMQIAHIWHLMSAQGALVGLAFIFLELLVLLLALSAMHISSKEKPAMVYLAMLLLAVMLALVIGVFRWFFDDLFSVVVVTALVVSLADPVGFATSKIALQHREAAVGAREREHAAKVDAFNQRQAAAMETIREALAIAEHEREEARLQLEHVRSTNATEIQQRVSEFSTQVKDSFQTALGVVQARDELVTEKAGLNTERERFRRTQTQIRQEVEQEFAGVVAGLETTIRSLQQQLRNAGGHGYPQTPGTAPASESAAHVITQDGRPVDWESQD